MNPGEAKARGVPRTASRIILAALGATFAAWLLWFAASTHLQRACLVLDTPYLPLCPVAAPESDPARLQDLRTRLRENPGDSGAWVALASQESGANRQALLGAVATLAPSDPEALRLRALDALAKNQMPMAVALLVKMTDHRIGGAEPP
ncbi:MAG TPA: hypothetical protein VGA59_05305, partial [Ramlibacter sp.]